MLLVVIPAAAAIAVVAVLVGTVLAENGGAGTAAGPRVGRDHWHASYVIVICNELQPPAPFWESGIHTHDDGIIHIHPFTPSEQGRGARLVKWFEYGGGELTDDSLRVPGTRRTLHNGDECPDGSTGRITVSVNDMALDDWSEYIPQDGDNVIIVFGR